MKRTQIYFLFCFLTTVLNAQIIEKFGEFGQFENASSFSINQAGIIFAADRDKNEIYKIDTLGNELRFIGGYGWSQSAFDNPSDVFATTLNVYITDKNNSRVQIFDKDLNYLSQFQTNQNENSDYQFDYPECSSVSNQGDLYILDSDNSRILKYGLSGNFLLEIGGNSAGEYSLSDPKHFSVSPEGKIFVIDGGKVFIFDQYGAGLSKLDINIEADKIAINRNKILLNSMNELIIKDLKNINSGSILFTKDNLGIVDSIVESILYNNKLYVLSESSIHIYKFLK